MNIIMPKHVEVTKNGLIFYSNYQSKFGVHSFLLGKEIKIERISAPVKETNKHDILKKVIIGLVLLISGFVLHPYVSIHILSGICAFLLFAYNNFFMLCKDFFHSHIAKKNRERQQFRTAKHMVLNSYKKLNGIPNLWELENKYYDECKLYLRIHNTFAGLLVSIAFCFYEFSNIFGLLLFFTIGLVICVIISNIIHKLKIFLYLEWLFLAEPTNLQLETAIKGLEMWLQIENKISKEL